MSREPLAKRGVELPAFNESRSCPMCRCDKVGTRYVPQQGCSDPFCSTCEAEHLERMCERCRYRWAEKPYDDWATDLTAASPATGTDTADG